MLLSVLRRVQVRQDGDQRSEPVRWVCEAYVRGREEESGGGQSSHRAGGAAEVLLHELLPAARSVPVQRERAELHGAGGEGVAVGVGSGAW